MHKSYFILYSILTNNLKFDLYILKENRSILLKLHVSYMYE